MKRSILLLLFVCALVSANAQNKLFTLNDVIAGGNNYENLKPERFKQLTWLKNANYYSYTENDVLVVKKAGKHSGELSLTVDELNKIISGNLVHFPAHKWFDGWIMQFKYGNTLYFIDVKHKKLSTQIALPSGAANIDISTNGKKIAYTLGNNLYVATNAFHKITVTIDTQSGITNGQYVHRNEFGIRKGTFWSPDSELLAFYRKNETMVKEYPLVDISGRISELAPTRYCMAGTACEQVQVGIYNPQLGTTIFLETGNPKDRFFTNLSWSPDSKLLYIAELNRDQNHMQLVCYNAQNGKKLKTLFEEKHDKYVEPEHKLSFSPSAPNTFIWQSERDGFNHLYLYNINGKLVSQLTQGNWMVTRFHGWDNDGENIYITSTEKSPIERHLFKVDVNSGKKTALTSNEGTHNIKLSDDKKYALDQWSSVDIPGNTDLISTLKSGKKETLLTAKNPYSNYKLGNTKIVELLSDDAKTKLYGRLITPANMKAGKKYPVIVYVYGGPHAQLVHNKWMAGARMWQHYMAQKGYIAFTLDNRGSDGRGLEFENVIHRNLGVHEMEDQVTGINYLESLDFVDTSRIGVHGWSYGGFMTTNLMTHHPNIFKVGVAGGPVIDWKYYEIMYGERYMDTPAQNPDGYKNSSLLYSAKDLKGKLMLIHGDMDNIVLLQHSLQFVEKCVDANIPIDYFIYPGYQHNVRGKDRVHLMNKVSQYFIDYL